MKALSLSALRRHVVTTQGFAHRFRRASDDDIVQCVSRLSCVQLDSIATVERSHALVLGSRIGAIESSAVTRLLAQGCIFEYWAHEASLLPINDWPLFRTRMRERQCHHWWGPVIESDPTMAKRVIEEIRSRGPLGSRHFEGKGGSGMWQLKPAKRMLDALWTAGQLVVCGRQGFQRLYDLPERVIPLTLLNAPPLDEVKTLRRLIIRAVRSRGALTARGVVDHYRLSGGVAAIAPQLDVLCRAGELARFDVEDGGPPVYLPAGCDPIGTAKPTAAVFLSPFENMLWDRAFTKRLFGFDHLIEVYKREHQRAYGYYVLPLLVGDRLVGRADLKAERDSGLLRMKAFQPEPGVRTTGALASSVEKAMARLARALALDPILPEQLA